MAEEFALIADLDEARALRAAAAGDEAAIDALWWAQRALLWRALCAWSGEEQGAIPLFVALHRERRSVLRAVSPRLGAELSAGAALCAWLRARGAAEGPAGLGRVVRAISLLTGHEMSVVADALGVPLPRGPVEPALSPRLLGSTPPALPLPAPRPAAPGVELRALLLLVPLTLGLGLAARLEGPLPVDPCAGPGGPLRSGAPAALTAELDQAGVTPGAAQLPPAPVGAELIGVERADPVVLTLRFELDGEPLRAGRAPAPLLLPRAGVVEGPGGMWLLRRAREGAAVRCWATPEGPGAAARLDAALRPVAP
ncbi:MAG: hypothetical protein JNM72_10830 [Deltaproteobacteria bacterium]|nr:hypothetical protein [Deltaproteobacteria bacterium]